MSLVLARLISSKRAGSYGPPPQLLESTRTLMPAIFAFTAKSIATMASAGGPLPPPLRELRAPVPPPPLPPPPPHAIFSIRAQVPPTPGARHVCGGIWTGGEL